MIRRAKPAPIYWSLELTPESESSELLTSMILEVEGVTTESGELVITKVRSHLRIGDGWFNSDLNAEQLVYEHFADAILKDGTREKEDAA